MRKNEAFPSQYLKQDDVDPPRTYSIKSVDRQLVAGDDGEETKTVVSFDDCDQQFILNGINWDTCAEIFGSDDSDDWTGKQIELYRDPSVMYGNKRTGGTRVRAPSRNHVQTAPVQPELLSWEQAKAACAEVGITKEELKGHLTSQGSNGWRTDRDTPIVRALVASKKQNPGEKVDGEEVPFD